MKPIIPSIALALLALCPIDAWAQNVLGTDPGYLDIDKSIDLKTARPEVNINLPRFLLKDAASFFNGKPGDPFAEAGINFGDLTKDVKLIRVVAFEVGKKNKDIVEKGVKALRAELEAKWTPIVTMTDEKGIYVRSDPAGEAMAGLALIAQDDREAVIANVVGKVSIAKLLEIASHADKLPNNLRELLKQLSVNLPDPEEKSKPPIIKAQAPPSATK